MADLADLLVQSADIIDVTPAGTYTDEGVPIVSRSVAATVACRVSWSKGGTQFRDGRDQTVQDGRVYFPAGTVITTLNEVTVDGQTNCKVVTVVTPADHDGTDAYVRADIETVLK